MVKLTSQELDHTCDLCNLYAITRRRCPSDDRHGLKPVSPGHFQAVHGPAGVRSITRITVTPCVQY